MFNFRWLKYFDKRLVFLFHITVQYVHVLFLEDQISIFLTVNKKAWTFITRYELNFQILLNTIIISFYLTLKNHIRRIYDLIIRTTLKTIDIMTHATRLQISNIPLFSVVAYIWIYVCHLGISVDMRSLY